jgi:ABC-2 type transport system ATP-binding protein
MSSVEELCDNIALINKSKKILDGSVKEIRKQFKSNIYEIEFVGNMMGFTNSLWTFGKLLEHTVEGNRCKALVQLIGEVKSNQLLQAVMQVAEIHSFKEITPSMNDIFIAKVNAEINVN